MKMLKLFSVILLVMIFLAGCVTTDKKGEIITPYFIDKPVQETTVNFEDNHLYVSYDANGNQVVSGLITIDSKNNLSYLRVSSLEKTLWYTDILNKFDEHFINNVLSDKTDGNVYVNGNFKFGDNVRTVLLYPEGKDLPQSISKEPLFNKSVVENGKIWSPLQFDENNYLFAVSNESTNLLVFDNKVNISTNPTDLEITLDKDNLYFEILENDKLLYKMKDENDNDKIKLKIVSYTTNSGNISITANSEHVLIPDMSNIKGPFVLNNSNILYAVKKNNVISSLDITDDLTTSSTKTFKFIGDNRSVDDFELVGEPNAEIDNNESHVSTITYGDIIDGYTYENSTFIVLKDLTWDSTMVVRDLTQGATNLVEANHKIPLVVLEFPYDNTQSKTLIGDNEVKIHYLDEDNIINDNSKVYISPENYIIVKNEDNSLYKMDLRSSIPSDFIVPYKSGNLSYNIKFPYLQSYKLNVVNLTTNRLSSLNINSMDFYDNYGRFAYITYNTDKLAIYDILKDNLYPYKTGTSDLLNKNMSVEEFTQVFEEIIRKSK
jgi:hypothetical protein